MTSQHINLIETFPLGFDVLTQENTGCKLQGRLVMSSRTNMQPKFAHQHGLQELVRLCSFVVNLLMNPNNSSP